MIVLQGARAQVELLLFSPESRALIAPYSRGVQVWNDLGTRRPHRAVLPHRRVCWVRFTPDGQKVLLVESRPYRLALRDVPTGKVAEVPLELPSPLWTDCDLAPDGRSLVAAQGVVLPEPLTRVFCRALDDLTSSTWSVATDRSPLAPPLFLAGGERFVLFEWCSSHFPEGFRYHPVYVTRDTRTGTVLSEVASSGDSFRSPVLSPDRRLIACHRGVWAAVFQSDDMACDPVKIRNDNRKEFTGLAFHPSGRYLAATSNDATVKLYDTSTWKVAQSYNWDIGRLRSVTFSPDGMLAAAGGDKGKIVVWDVDL
jgi:WD40 repeat protein